MNFSVYFIFKIKKNFFHFISYIIYKKNSLFKNFFLKNNKRKLSFCLLKFIKILIKKNLYIRIF
jgi:hypothetical protein